MATEQKRPWPAIALLCLISFLCVIYLATASQQYDADVLVELHAINNLDATSSDPGHMLYVRMGVPFYRLWLAWGYVGDALLPMQLLNALFAGATILLLALLQRHYRVSWTLALPLGLAAGLSYAFWTHTVDAFFIIPAAFFALLAWFGASRLSVAGGLSQRLLWSGCLGLGLSLATLFYQASLAFAPALVLASWPQEGHSCSRALKNWALVFLVVAFLAGGGFLLQGIRHAGVSTGAGFVDWFLSHGGIQNKLWRTDGVNLLATVPQAWMATLLPLYEGLRLRSLLGGTLVPDRLPSQLALLFLLAVVVYTVTVAVRNRWVLWKDPSIRRGLLTCILWFSLPAVTVIWFDPAEVKLWLVPFFSLWIALALILNQAVSGARGGRVVRWLPYVAAWGLAVLIPLANLLLPVWPNRVTPSEKLAMAREAIARMAPEDLLVSATFDWTGYVGYLSDDLQVLNAIAVAQTHGKGAVHPLLQRGMQDVWDAGARVYVVDYFGPERRQIWSDWITPHTQLVPEDWEALRRHEAWRSSGQIVWELLPPP